MNRTGGRGPLLPFVLLCAMLAFVSLSVRDVIKSVDGAEAGPRSVTEMTMLPAKKRSPVGDAVAKKPTFPASLGPNPGTAAASGDGAKTGNREAQFPAWYSMWQREERLRNRERQRKDALLRNRGILAGAQQRLMGNGPRASADGSSTAGDPSQIGTRSIKQHLPSCDKVTDRSIPCVPGAVLIDADGNVSRPDGTKDYPEAILHYTGAIPPEPGSPVDASGQQQQVPSSPHAVIVGATGNSGKDGLQVVTRAQQQQKSSNRPRDEASSLSEGKDDLVVESLPADDGLGAQQQDSAGSAYSLFPMSYGADAQLNPSHPFYYYFANPAGSNLDPRSPGAATGAGAGEGVTPMMMMVPSPGTDGAAAGPVLMPFAFPPGGSLPAGMDPQQLFQEVVAPPIRKPIDDSTGNLPQNINWMMRGPDQLVYTEMQDFLFQLVRFFRDRARLEVVGYTVENRTMYSVVLCYNKQECENRPLLKPKILMVANMAGNDGVSKAIITFLAEYLLFYMDVNPRIHKLLSRTEVHIIPSVNQDGFERTFAEWRRLRLFSNISAGAVNANGVNLVTDYPIISQYDSIFQPGFWDNRQPETIGMMRYKLGELFVLTGGFSDDGMEVRTPLYADYEFMRNISWDKAGIRTPDADVFNEIASVYVDLHTLMNEPEMHCPGRPTLRHKVVSGIFGKGNRPGHISDWTYKFANSFDLWILFSCVPMVQREDLENVWQRNVNPILSFMESVHRGVKGMVWENGTATPLQDVFIEVRYRRHRIRTNERGEYWRLLSEGVYQIRPVALGYEPCAWEQIVVLNVAGPTIKHFSLIPLGLD